MKRTLLITALLLTSFLFSQSSQEYVLMAKEKQAQNFDHWKITTFLEKALEMDSNNDEALYMLAEIKAKKRGFHYALNYINKAIEIDSLKPEYYLLRAKVSSNMGLNSHNLEKGVKSALKDLDIMLELGEKTAEVYYLKGRLQEYVADDMQTEIHYKDKTELKPVALQYYLNAKENYEYAISIDPEHKCTEYLMNVTSEIEKLDK